MPLQANTVFHLHFFKKQLKCCLFFFSSSSPTSFFSSGSVFTQQGNTAVSLIQSSEYGSIWSWTQRRGVTLRKATGLWEAGSVRVWRMKAILQLEALLTTWNLEKLNFFDPWFICAEIFSTWIKTWPWSSFCWIWVYSVLGLTFSLLEEKNGFGKFGLKQEFS